MRHSTQFMREKLMRQRPVPGVGSACAIRPGFTTALALFACLAMTAVPAAGLPDPEPAGPAPAAPGSQVTEGFINAPVAEVWRLFTTSAGYQATGVDQAEVDLRVGGLIRSHYDPKGTLGDPETKIGRAHV